MHTLINEKFFNFFLDDVAKTAWFSAVEFFPSFDARNWKMKFEMSKNYLIFAFFWEKVIFKIFHFRKKKFIFEIFFKNELFFSKIKIFKNDFFSKKSKKSSNFLTFQISFADFDHQIRKKIQLLTIRLFLPHHQEKNWKTSR